LGQTADALKCYQDGLEISRRLAESNPGDAQAQRDLSISYNKLGDVTLQLGQTADALKCYQDGLEISRRLAESNAGDAQAQRDLMYSHYKLARAERQQFEHTAAQTQYQEAIEVLERMLKRGLLKEQTDREMQIIKREAASCAQAAIALAGLKEIDEADVNSRPTLLYLRCYELARKGEVAAVAEAADKLQQLAGENADQLYNAACGYSLCVRVFDTPPRGGVFLPPEEFRELPPDEPAAREKYIKLALETLARAIAAGCNNADQLRQDDDLTPLRPLPEFQKLLEKLGTQD
jgi:tetratricopeptide (TPR) repeat protein